MDSLPLLSGYLPWADLEPTRGPARERRDYSFFCTFFVRVKEIFLDALRAECFSCLIGQNQVSCPPSTDHGPRDLTKSLAGGKEGHWNENEDTFSMEEGGI